MCGCIKYLYPPSPMNKRHQWHPIGDSQRVLVASSSHSTVDLDVGVPSAS